MKKLTIGILLAAAVCAMAAVPFLVPESGDVRGAEEAVPVNLRLSGGAYRDSVTGWAETHTLNADNGAYVNLYIENTGDVAVVASINGKSEQTVQPGEHSCISTKVTQKLFGGDQEYTFQATPVSGNSSFRFDVVQQAEQDSLLDSFGSVKRAFMSETEILNEQYCQARADYIFEKFGMDPEAYQFALSFDVDWYTASPAYTFVRKTILHSGGASIPAFYVTEDADRFFVVYQNADAVNYMYEYALNEEGDWYIKDLRTEQDTGRYHEVVQSFEEYSAHTI